MKKYILYFTSALLIMSLAGCSSLTNSAPGTIKDNDVAGYEEDDDETEETEPSDASDIEITEQEVTEVTEETVETTETEVTEKTVETTETTTKPSETEPSETEPTSTSADTVVTVDDKYSYINVNISSDSSNLELNDGSYYVGMYWENVEVSGSPKLTEAIDMHQEAIYDEIEQYVVDHTEFATYVDKNSYYYSSYYATFTASRSDNQVFSGHNLVTTYNGNNNESTAKMLFMNIDPNTGKDILLSDLIDNEDEFKAYIYNEFYDLGSYTADMEDYVCDMDLDDMMFEITPQGIDVYFEPATVLLDETEFPYVSFKYFLNDYFFKYDLWSNSPENRIIPFDSYDDFDALVLEDLSYITCDFTEEDYWYTSVTITTSEATETFDYYGYEHNSYLVTYDDNQFIVISALEDNDYRTNFVFDITYPSEIAYCGYFNGYLDSFINPDCFKITQRLHLLSSITIFDNYEFSILGMPVQLNDEYQANAQFMTSKVDLTTTDGQVVPAGTELKTVRTDAETYVIMIDDSDNEYKFEVYSYDQICDMSVYDAFEEEDILFAG